MGWPFVSDVFWWDEFKDPGVGAVIQQLNVTVITLTLAAVIVFVSPLVNIYLIAKNAKNRSQKLVTVAIGVGLYVVFLCLMFITFFVSS